MNIDLEKILILTTMGVFIISSITAMGAPGGPITEEEAMEISRNASLVREGMATYEYITSEATYYNASYVEQVKKESAREYAYVPEGHAIWKVTWEFNLGPGLMVGHIVIVIVDNETGAILYEIKGPAFG